MKRCGSGTINALPTVYDFCQHGGFCSSTSNNAGATYNQRPPEFFNNLDRRMIS